MFKVTSRPAAIEIGRLPSPLTEKALPETLIFETVTAAVPSLTRDTLALAFVPSDTPPKLTELGDDCRIRVLIAALTGSPPRQSRIMTYKKKARRAQRGFEKGTRRSAFRRERSQLAAIGVLTSYFNGEQRKLSRNLITYAPIDESGYFMACSHVTAHAWMLARASQSDKPAPSARTNKFRIARHSRASVALPWQRDF